MSTPMDDLMGNALTEPVSDVEETEEVQVDIVDDRPEEDRVSPRDTERGGGFDPDAEIEVEGGKASKRINQLRYEYHEERRAKEAAERMREEAVRYARQAATENQELKALLHRGEEALLSEMSTRTDSDLDNARAKYKTAYEAGDSDALLKAQEALTTSQHDKFQVDRVRPALERAVEEPSAPAPVQSQAPPKVDENLRGWVQKNEWFGKDSEMTSFAFGVHEKLVKGGMNPDNDPKEYYGKLDQRLREVFPGKFENGRGAEEPAASSRTSTVVAPAGRSSSKPRIVQLTSTQVSLAKRLGLSPEQYANQLLKESRNV